MHRYFPAILLALVTGCSSAPPLTDARPSAEAMAGAVLEALARHDRATLEALALDEQEFHDHVWPSLPAARPERNLPFSYVWGELRQKSEAALTEILAKHGGRRYELLEVAFDRATDFGPYRVHRQARLQVRDGAGQTTTIRVCGSMLETDGVWKVFSYVIDE